MIYLLIYPAIGLILVAVAVYQKGIEANLFWWITVFIALWLWPFAFGKQILFDCRYLWNKAITFLHLK